MSRRTSRLDTLLRVRRIQEEIRRGLLAREVMAERRALQTLEQSHERYAAPVAERAVAPEMTRVFLANRRDRGALAGSVRAASAGVDAAAQVTFIARHVWSEAAMRMAALERLEDRARDAERTERLTTEQRTSDESGSARHQRGPARSTQEKRP